MRECGLKRAFRSPLHPQPFVTPHAGVWIETQWENSFAPAFKSLPMRECGLKLMPTQTVVNS